MRSATRVTFIAGLAAAGIGGCGNFSNDDLMFFEAVPTKEQLQVVLPQSAAQALCPPSPDATVWVGDPTDPNNKGARGIRDDINGFVDGLVALVDSVRKYPPTSRSENGRVWGPYDSPDHPGIQFRI